MRAAGGSTDVMANYLPIMLKPTTMNWLTSLGSDTIESWDDIKRMFVENYMATSERLATRHDLERIYQKAGELLRSYVRRFLEIRNRIPNISQAEVISAFVRGLYQHDELHSMFNRKPPWTIGEMP